MSAAKRSKMFSPIHPGEILLEEFMKPLGLSNTALARALHVQPRRIRDLVSERQDITGDTALRLSRYFRMSPEFWMGLQKHYELDVAKDAAGKEIKAKVRPSKREAA